MNHLTQKSMNKILTTATIFFCISFLGGCDTSLESTEDLFNRDGGTKQQNDGGISNKTPDATGDLDITEAGNDPLLSFDVPESWTYINEQENGGLIGATLEVDTEISSINKVNFQIHDIYVGDDDLAKDIAEKHYESTKCVEPYCEPTEGWPNSDFKSLKLPNGITIYANISPTSIENHWYSKEDSNYSWSSDFTFSKNGYVMFAYLSDRIDLYIDEFETITSTLETKNR